MKTMPVGELKAGFADVLREVGAGQPVAVTFGRKKKKVAVLVPYEQYCRTNTRSLGVFEGKATYRIGKDFPLSDGDLTSP